MHPALNSPRTIACRAERASVAHSANNKDVGVSLRQIVIVPAPIGSLIPTYNRETRRVGWRHKAFLGRHPL